MLRGMGFDKSTSIYLASGKIYNAEKTMAPLLEMFPQLKTKEMLASEEELAPFKVRKIPWFVCLVSNDFYDITILTLVVLVELFFQDGCDRLHCLSS